MSDKTSQWVLRPGDPGWPAALDDLGPHAPESLYVSSSNTDPAAFRAALAKAVSIVGARAATAYGEHLASLMAANLAASGFTIISGGAYGIDAAAHRAALNKGLTVAVMACGLDQFYPPANENLLREIARRGWLVSEHPPGTPPARDRFLTRNRLIAALGQAAVVVEAAVCSKSLNTAAHAHRLGRPVGAAPGPVTSAASIGCHQLIQSGAAKLVTDADDVLAML
ncbi:MAG: DNA-processing protein DprA [Bifidobacteriaceae bacterium]|jgi:DNA processing protein|nr:DNA-processing protein DprA [Bifidobacteriaceae bacterium]